MNIIIPPKTVAFMRNSVAFAVAIAVSLWMAPVNGGIYEIPFLMMEVAIAPFIAMISTKEIRFVALFVTFCTWLNAFDIYRMSQSHIISSNRSLWELFGDTLFMWGFGTLLAFISILPVFLWRRWRRQKNKLSLIDQWLRIKGDRD